MKSKKEMFDEMERVRKKVGAVSMKGFKLIPVSEKPLRKNRVHVALDKPVLVKQCEWTCPLCGKRCGGIEGHLGEHQCPVHYIVKICANCDFMSMLRKPNKYFAYSKGYRAVRKTVVVNYWCDYHNSSISSLRDACKCFTPKGIRR